LRHASTMAPSDASMQAVRKLGLLGSARLQACPAEYQQKVRSWDSLLRGTNDSGH
ncbi:MAG: hypothetical protein JWO02_4379, partial [Solirubrobacterales bacterium]|nr:hypothetical protein [Solirubrobacterales bacterium]